MRHRQIRTSTPNLEGDPMSHNARAWLAGYLALAAIAAHAQTLKPGEREARITAIPGVVAAGARWQAVWSDFASADGIVGTPDGGVLFAQEQTDQVLKLAATGEEYVYIEHSYGIGAVSVDAQGRLFGVERTCTEPLNPELAGCNVLTRVVQLAPERRLLANSFPDGRPLGRLNDVIGDGRGGAYFTVGGAYHVSAEGVVSTVEDQNLRSNGIMLSRDGRTLYVTNNTVVLAFDVGRDGMTSNRRDFGTLNGDNGGDGMAIDADGRLYVTGSAGVHVLSSAGQYLGLIPTPRRPITVAFSGPDKRTLYVPQIGALGPDGQPWETPEGIRNIAMTVYTLTMEARGYAGRPK
jgi:gluconolactonase